MLEFLSSFEQSSNQDSEEIKSSDYGLTVFCQQSYNDRSFDNTFRFIF